MKIAVNTGSFRTIDIIDVLNVLNMTSIRTLELNLRPIIEGTAAKEKIYEVLKDNGFILSNLAGGWCDFFVNRSHIHETRSSVEKQVELCHYFGNNRLRLFFGLLEEKYTTDHRFDILIQNVDEIAGQYKEIDFLFENHDYNSLNPDFLLRFFKNINSKNVFMNFDPVNFSSHCIDWENAYRMLSSYIRHYHIKGFRGGKIHAYRKSELDFSNLYHELLANSYSDYLSLEYEGEADTMSNLLLDYQQLKQDIDMIKRF